MKTSRLARWARQSLAVLLVALCLPVALGPSITLAATRASSQLGAIYVLNGTPSFLGVITATTTKNNHDSAVPFANTGDALKGKTVLIQCDEAAYILPGIANTATVTTANGVQLAADERVLIMMQPGYGWIAALAVSGTVNCRVWELL